MGHIKTLCTRYSSSPKRGERSLKNLKQLKNHFARVSMCLLIHKDICLKRNAFWGQNMSNELAVKGSKPQRFASSVRLHGAMRMRANRCFASRETLVKGQLKELIMVHHPSPFWSDPCPARRMLLASAIHKKKLFFFTVSNCPRLPSSSL